MKKLYIILLCSISLCVYSSQEYTQYIELVRSQTGSSAQWRELCQQGVQKLPVDASEISVQENQESQNALLMLAAYGGRWDIMQTLFAQGVKLDVQDALGETALHMAAWGGQKEVVQNLLNLGVDINIRSPEGVTPLMEATTKGGIDVARLLLEHGADVNALDNNRRTALMLASNKGNADMVHKLLRHKANPDLQDINGETALIRAVHKEFGEIVDDLLLHNANVEAQNNNGITSLMAASYKENANMVDKLLRHKANPDLKDKNQRTVLMDAAARGCKEMVDLLLNHRADMNLTNDKKQTALDLAEYNNHAHIATLLRARLPIVLRPVENNDNCLLCLTSVEDLRKTSKKILQMQCCGQVVCDEDLELFVQDWSNRLHGKRLACFFCQKDSFVIKEHGVANAPLRIVGQKAK